MRKIKWLLLFVVIYSCKTKTTVDLVVHNARVYTVDSVFTVTEAFAVKAGKIVATGTSNQILDQYTSDSVLDAKQQTIYPGFIDGHAHFFGYALSLQQVNLVGTKSWDECITRIQAFVAEKNIPAGHWITGNGWDQNDWENKAFPDKALLDKNFPNNPVLLSRIDGHAAIANQQALDIAKLKAGDIVNGGIIETKGNLLTGILVDNAISKVSAVIPEESEDAMEKTFLDAQHNCFAVGLTGVTDCGLMKKQVDYIDKLQKSNKLKMRLTGLLSDAPESYEHYLKTGIYKTGACILQGLNYMQMVHWVQEGQDY